MSSFLRERKALLLGGGGGVWGGGLSHLPAFRLVLKEASKAAESRVCFRWCFGK